LVLSSTIIIYIYTCLDHCPAYRTPYNDTCITSVIQACPSDKTEIPTFFSTDEQQQMREEIRVVINVLSSPEIAVDQLHGPHHHAQVVALVSEAPVLSPNSHKAVPLHPLSGGYVDAVGSGSYSAGVMSSNGALPMNSAFEPAMMNLYNNTAQTPIAGSWTYAPSLTAGVYSNHNHNTVPTRRNASSGHSGGGPSRVVPAAVERVLSLDVCVSRCGCAAVSVCGGTGSVEYAWVW
jgi:hypothetical protein